MRIARREMVRPRPRPLRADSHAGGSVPASAASGTATKPKTDDRAGVRYISLTTRRSPRRPACSTTPTQWHTASRDAPGSGRRHTNRLRAATRLCGKIEPVTNSELPADCGLLLQIFDVHPARQHTNLRTVIEGSPVVVAAAHAKIRRDGYRGSRQR